MLFIVHGCLGVSFETDLELEALLCPVCTVWGGDSRNAASINIAHCFEVPIIIYLSLVMEGLWYSGPLLIRTPYMRMGLGLVYMCEMPI